MTLPKRTYEKPLPISPSIVLDRERCILCYRCTRFSSDVAEDGELIARERGAQQRHRDLPGAPVRRRVLRQRDRAVPGRRPAADAVPLQGAAVGDRQRADRVRRLRRRLQHVGHGARGPVERVLSRNHPEVDEGWLCDRGRFARYEPLADRLTEPLAALRGRASRPSRGTRPRARSRQRLRHVDAPRRRRARSPSSPAATSPTRRPTPGAAHRAATSARVTASGPVAAAGAWELLDPYAARIDDLDRADVIVVVGDADVAGPRRRARPAHPQGAPARRAPDDRRPRRLAARARRGHRRARRAGATDRAGARRASSAIPARWPPRRTRC